MTERLRLEAEFRDRGVAAGLKKIGGELAHIRRTPGMEAATEWIDRFHEKAKGFAVEGGGISGTMTAMGIGGLTAAASLAELAKTFKELADRTLAMKELGRETGLTTNQIMALNKAAEEFHVAPEKMQAAISAFKGQMPDFLANSPNSKLWNEIHGRFPKLSEALKRDKGDTEKQLEDVFSFVGQAKLQRDPQLQKKILEAFFGNGDEMEKLMAKGAGAFMEAAKGYERTLPDTKRLETEAEAFDEATRKFNEAVDNLELKAGPTILAGMKGVLDDFRDLFQNLERLETWWDKVKGHPGQIAKDAGGAVGRFLHDEAVPEWIKRNNAENALRGEDGNALRRNDEMPARPGFKGQGRSGEDGNALRRDDARQTGERGWLGRLFHRSAFEMGGSAPDGFADAIAEGVKAGVLEAYRELMVDRTAAGQNGFQNASFTTGWSAGSRGERSAVGRGGGSGFNDTSGGGSSGFKGAMADRINHVMGRLIDKGWTREAAASAVGQFIQESGVRSDGPAGDHGTAHGMAQWRFERFKALKDFAAAQGKSWKDLDAQTDFFDHEVGKRGMHAWRTIHDLKQGALFGKRYEGYGDNSDLARLQGSSRALRSFQPPAKRQFTLPDAARQQRESRPDGPAGTIRADIHLHDRNGEVKRVGLQTAGVVSGKLHRWPMMTTPSDEA